MSPRTWILVGVIVVIALGASQVASERPDGLERVAQDLGFADRETAHFQAPLPDYAVPAAGRWSGPLAGLLGAAGVGALSWGAGRLLVRRA